MTKLLWLAFAISFQALATPAINTLGTAGSLFSDPKPTGVAIRGYDPVAYFKMKRPVLGQDMWIYRWSGAVWKFSSAEHLELFKENPTSFAPQYGGYCAYGAARNYLVKIEPDAFSIINGKLYLNYDKKIQKKWEKKTVEYIREADKNYPSLID